MSAIRSVAIGAAAVALFGFMAAGASASFIQADEYPAELKAEKERGQRHGDHGRLRVPGAGNVFVTH